MLTSLSSSEDEEDDEDADSEDGDADADMSATAAAPRTSSAAVSTGQKAASVGAATAATTPTKRAGSSAESNAPAAKRSKSAADSSSKSPRQTKASKKKRPADFNPDTMEDFFRMADRGGKGYLSVTDLVECAAQLGPRSSTGGKGSNAAGEDEGLTVDAIEDMLAEANKSGPRNARGQPMHRVYLKDFLDMMVTCGLIDSKE